MVNEKGEVLQRREPARSRENVRKMEKLLK